MNRTELIEHTTQELESTTRSLIKVTATFDEIQGRYNHFPRPLRSIARFMTRGREAGIANLRDRVNKGYSSVAQLEQELDILTAATNLELDHYDGGSNNSVYHIWGKLHEAPLSIVQYIVTEPIASAKRRILVNRISGFKGNKPIEDFYAHKLMAALLPVLKKRNNGEKKPNHIVFSNRNWVVFEKLAKSQGTISETL